MKRQWDAVKCKEELIQWIKDYFAINGPKSKAIIGLSGGIDSSLTLALCVEALGADRVVGVLLPNGQQEDIDYSIELVDLFKIKYHTINIELAMNAIYSTLGIYGLELNEMVTINTPARMRMLMLYNISAIEGGRVSCNCNFDEDFVGYSTKFGDDAGDFALLKNLLKSELKEVAKLTILPQRYIDKTPIDGLCGQSDEERMGVTYDEIEEYIKNVIVTDVIHENQIKKLHEYGLHKVNPIPYYKYYEDRSVC